MKFYLSLTDEQGQLIDRFRIELPPGENPADELVGEDSECLAHGCIADMAMRLLRVARRALKESR